MEIDFAALISKTEQIVYDGNMLMAEKGVVPVQDIVLEDGQEYQLSIMMHLKDGVSSSEEKDIERLTKERKSLIDQLRQFIKQHETGLLPNKFTYEDAVMLLNSIGE